MTFHENRLLADDSHAISRKLGKMSQNVSFAAVVVGALRAKKTYFTLCKLGSLACFFFAC